MCSCDYRRGVSLFSCMQRGKHLMTFTDARGRVCEEQLVDMSTVRLSRQYVSAVIKICGISHILGGNAQLLTRVRLAPLKMYVRFVRQLAPCFRCNLMETLYSERPSSPLLD